MKILIAFVILTVFPAAFAQIGGTEFVKVPEGAISKVDTEIYAKIENWGYERVFVALPEGWKIDDIQQGVTSYPVRYYGLIELYGVPYGDTPLGRGDVYTYTWTYYGFSTARTIEVAGRTGWYLKPNEGIIINIKVNDIGVGGGIIDPFKIEKENPGIKVDRWEQRFLLTVTKNGFITAPWIVEGGVLTEASPAPYSEAKKRGSYKYYEDFEIKYTGIKWNQWFEFKNSVSTLLSSKPLAATDLEFYPIEKKNILRPVFRVDNFKTIMYAYDWKRDRKIEGIVLLRDDFKDVPEWFKWF
ncbi:MAG: hypothetical protein ABH874_02805 [Methanobacteriota archaeon]